MEKVTYNNALGEDARLVAPIMRTGKGFYVLGAVLLAIFIWAFLSWGYQLLYGLGVTGLNKPVYWGFYITNFVFFIGISFGGTLVSAILRLCQAEWRRPITRAAEALAVLVLFFGVFNVLLDLGRPDRAYFVFTRAHPRSPLIWDVTAINTYLVVTIIYLYLPMIPDIALLRDHVPRYKLLYRILALGWKGTPRQERILHFLVSILAVVIIPIAVSVHSVLGWVFGMTVQPMWHSTIFGPYFVMGAMYSGIGALIVAMAVLRKAYHLEDYLKPVHFENLGRLLLVMTFLWFYFTFAEYLTAFYGNEPVEMTVFYSKITGEFAPYFWTMVASCFVIPFTILCNRRTRTITGTVIASLFVILGMWLERYLIVVPTLVRPRLPYTVAPYFPSWVEWSTMAGCFALFIFLYALFSKFFPVISIWEIQEGRERSIPETVERISEYLPGKARQVENH
ncbi:MAG: polysulfide reductase [Nitrospinota bacterium]|nr:MAG: polysulfide reductase [Nitrospinota bacterium]